MVSALQNGQTDVLNRLVGVNEQGFTPDVARYFLKLDFLETDHERMAELAEKAQLGELTPLEKAEMETYNQFGHLLAILQLRARRVLKQAGLSP
jgi:hypothetical protein